MQETAPRAKVASPGSSAFKWVVTLVMVNLFAVTAIALPGSWRLSCHAVRQAASHRRNLSTWSPQLAEGDCDRQSDRSNDA